MRVCIFSTTFFPQTGGAERFTHGLATHLKKMGVEVYVLVPVSGEKKSFKATYKILKLKATRLSSKNSRLFEVTLLLNLIGYHLLYNFDIIQAVILYPPGYVATLLKRFFKKLCIFCRPSGSDIQILPEINYGLRLDERIDKKIKASFVGFDGLIANSQSIKEELIKATCSPEKIALIPNGLDLEKFKRKPRNLRERFSLPPSSRVLLSVGRVHPKKNYGAFIEIMKTIVESYPKCYCVIVGGGEERLKPLVDGSGLKDRIILTGALLGDELVDIYLTSDIFVFPSLIEGQPNVLLEALAAGLPIVAADVAGSRDVVVDGQTGFLVEARDEKGFTQQVLKILESPALYAHLSKNAKKAARRYSWDKICSKYIDLYVKARS